MKKLNKKFKVYFAILNTFVAIEVLFLIFNFGLASIGMGFILALVYMVVAVTYESRKDAIDFSPKFIKELKDRHP